LFRKIIKKINGTFGQAIEIKNLLKKWNEEYSDTFRSVLLNKENQNLLKDIFLAEEGSILNILGNISESSLNLKTFRVIAFL